MKTRVTFILLLWTSLAANGNDTIKVQQTSANSRFPGINDSVKRSELTHRVYEYSKSMKTLDVDNRNEKIINAGIPSSGRSFTKESGSSLNHLNDVRVNTKQPSQAFEVEFVPLRNQDLSRSKKLKMEQAMLPLLIAYKMKFAALVPVLLGGLSLLASTTALAGFFFALFAAVLGLKAH